MRRGLILASGVAAALPAGAALVQATLGAQLWTTALSLAVALGFLVVRVGASRCRDAWLPTLAGVFGLSGLVGILVAVVTEPQALADYAVAFTGILPLGICLFVPWSTRAHLAWLAAGAAILATVLVMGIADPGIERERISLAAGFGIGGVISLLGQIAMRDSRRRIVEQTRAAHLRRSDLLTGRRELRAANGRAETSLRQLQGVEAIGRALAEQGPTPEALDGVAGLLVETFGYDHPSIYTSEGRLLRLGAQRGYARPIDGFDPSTGVIGRVARTRQAVFLPEVAGDADYVSADPAIRSEISIPLLAHGEFLGVLNVESRDRLGDRDLGALSVVADRVAAALALALERSRLAARAAIFQQLVTFSATVSSVLSARELYEVIVQAVDRVVPADLWALTVRDGAGLFVVQAEQGAGGAIGRIIAPGEGMAGRAIRDGILVRSADYVRRDFPPSLRSRSGPDSYGWAIGVPLIQDGETIGALTVARTDVDHPFTDLEIEALELMAGEVTLAVSNALLHGAVAEMAIRDPLTGLHNRRFFDEAFLTLTAGRARMPEVDCPPLAVILFDLDNFGDFNKRHGHLVGDDVLRVFGRILQGRLRTADLVARFGGEEFIAVLPGATRSDACRIAEEIRTALEATPVPSGNDESQTVTVSAGCAQAEPGGGTPDELIRAADVALAMAKRAGRNRVVTV